MSLDLDRMVALEREVARLKEGIAKVEVALEERDRYRTALERIAEPDHFPFYYQDVAREALEGKKQ